MSKVNVLMDFNERYAATRECKESWAKSEENPSAGHGSFVDDSRRTRVLLSLRNPKCLEPSSLANYRYLLRSIHTSRIVARAVRSPLHDFFADHNPQLKRIFSSSKKSLLVVKSSAPTSLRDCQEDQDRQRM